MATTTQPRFYRSQYVGNEERPVDVKAWLRLSRIWKDGKSTGGFSLEISRTDSPKSKSLYVHIDRYDAFRLIREMLAAVEEDLKESKA
jgi:hypothetical protein